jgi:type I restriction enzyme, R subunit
MSDKFTEYKTVQQRILEYAGSIGWKILTRSETEELRLFDSSKTLPEEQSKKSSLFLNKVFVDKISAFNPKYTENTDDLISRLSSLQSDIHGNREFLDYIRGEKTFYSSEEERELNLILIDFEAQKNNTYHVSEEYYFHNGRYGNREDIVFFINGIPVIVIECKNATQDEALSIGIDQIRRYHQETPEMLIPQQIFTVTESLGFLYGVTWNTTRKNLFQWKDEEVGNLESKVKTFFQIEHILAYIKDYWLLVPVS